MPRSTIVFTSFFLPFSERVLTSSYVSIYNECALIYSFVWNAICFLLQLCVWGTDGWEKQKSKPLQIPPGRTPSAVSDTKVQFHQDQIHFLVVHETQIAIFEANKLEREADTFSFTFSLTI